MTPTSGSPLSSGAHSSLRCRAQGGGPQLQPTGRTRQKRAEGMAGAAEEKPTKGKAHPPPPPSLWSSNSLILNLRLTPSFHPSHPIPTTQTHMHSSWSYHWLPSSHPQAMNGQTGDKTQQQPTQEVQPLGLGSERHILSEPLSPPLAVRDPLPSHNTIVGMVYPVIFNDSLQLHKEVCMHQTCWFVHIFAA